MAGGAKYYCISFVFPPPLLLSSVVRVQCKHLLAVRVAPALGVSRLEEVDDDKLAQRIAACDYG